MGKTCGVSEGKPPTEPPAPQGSLQAALPSPGALSRHACSGAALGRAQGHSPSSGREGGAPKETSNPHLQEDDGVGRGGGKTGRTTQLTCQPRSRLFLQEAKPRCSRGALPQRHRGDEDEAPPRPNRRRLQHRGQRPLRPAALSGVSAPRTAAAPWGAAPAPRLGTEAEPAPPRTCKLVGSPWGSASSRAGSQLLREAPWL